MYKSVSRCFADMKIVTGYGVTSATLLTPKVFIPLPQRAIATSSHSVKDLNSCLREGTGIVSATNLAHDVTGSYIHS
jgi:hypothetical protein